ncbi:DUF2934 domain-containing protein [Sphingomonas sp. ac-8]|uniref:DUF2934 domain-containing protein n=1 Tax=Sphingomonas sp. ac-8 TaxID=3242977 RepID=UPI003A80AA56
MNEREQRIRERAHALWQQEGEPEGHHERHWDDATREVDAQAAASTDAEVTPAPKKPRARRAAATKAASPVEPAATAGEAAKTKPAPRAKVAAKPAAAPAKRKPAKTKG